MKPRLPSVWRAAFCAVVSASALLSFSRAGDIVGRASDAKTGSFIRNATISVEGREAAATTNAEGRFRIVGLPAGAYRLTASSYAYDSSVSTINVGAAGEVTADFQLRSDVQVLSSFVVEGYVEGRAKATQEKRSADKIVDVISADSIGNLPDRNVAEALARLPGLNLSLEQGEGRYVSIRGAEPNLNQVMMDGATMAAPGGSRLGRAVPLDTLGAGQISSIEVVKSVTPDMDANAIGGSINIKSASAYDRKTRFLVGSVSGNRNANVAKTDAAAQVTYAGTFGPEKQFGLAASLTYDKRHYQNEWMQIGGYSLITVNGAPAYQPNDFELKPEQGSKERYGLSFNFEYRPSPSTQLYFRPNLSRTKNPEERFEVIFSPSTAVANITFNGPRSGTINAGNRTERRAFRYLTERDLDNYAAGLKQVVGAVSIEPMITYSRSEESTPYNKTREFRNASGQTGPITFDLGGFVPEKWVGDASVDIPSRYSLRRTRDDWGNIHEGIYTAKVDVRWDSGSILGLPGYLKTGGKFLKRQRTVDLESRRYVPVGTWNLSQTGDQLPSRGVYDDRFETGFLPSMEKIDAFIAANPALVTHDLVGESTNSIEDDYQIAEYIYAGYALAHLKLQQLTLVGGFRWEETNGTIRAVREVTVGSTVPIRVPTSGTKNYGNLFPNFQATYHFTKEVQLRGAFTETIGRPAYEDARTLAIFNYSPLAAPINPAYANSGSLTIGNPALKPYHSRNFDLSLEWYARKTGTVASVAAFRKEIADPIYQYSETERNVTYAGVNLETLSSTKKLNGQSGRISGLEFSLYQPLRFLPAPFDGFGVEANLTTISSTEVVPTRPGERIPFFRQPSKIKNLTLFYEKMRFSGRVSYTYAGEQIYTLGNTLIGDRYVTARGQYDAQVSYRLSAHYSLTASARNFTHVPDQMSYGIKSLLQASRLLYTDYKLSLNFNF